MGDFIQNKIGPIMYGALELPIFVIQRLALCQNGVEFNIKY